MLNPTRLKIFINAYYVRLSKNESLESIDESYIKSGRLNATDIEYIHSQLKID